MPQFTIKPLTSTMPSISFTTDVDIRVDGIENTHALSVNFEVNDVIEAGNELKATESHQGGNFIPEIIVNYTEI